MRNVIECSLQVTSRLLESLVLEAAVLRRPRSLTAGAVLLAAVTAMVGAGARSAPAQAAGVRAAGAMTAAGAPAASGDHTPETEVTGGQQVTGLALLGGRSVAAPAAAAGYPVPDPGYGLPGPWGDVPAYVPQRTCDPVAKPGLVKLRAILLKTYPGTGDSGIGTSCTGRDATSEHLEGRAFDWRVDIAIPREKAEAETFLSWLTAGNGAYARKMGVMYVIWDGRIWGTYSISRGWRAISCSGKTACHRDHVHISMTWDGAYARSPFWSRTVPVGQDLGPCIRGGQYFAPVHPASARNTAGCAPWTPLPPTDKIFPVLRANVGRTMSLHEQSNATATVMWIFGGEPATGRSTPLTGQHLAAFQLREHLARTGTVTPETWRALADHVSGGKVKI